MTDDDKLRAMQDQINAMKERVDALAWAVPARPAERRVNVTVTEADRSADNPDEALAKVARDAFNGVAPGRLTWDMQDGGCSRWVPVARAAREHIERNRPVDVTPLLEREREEQRDRAEKAEAERDEFNGFWKQALADVRKARDERDGWRAKHTALRADVERGAHYWNSYESSGKHTQNVARAAGYDLTAYLARDDDRTPQADPDTVTLPREDVDDPTNDRLCGPPHCLQREGHFMPCDWDGGEDR